MGGANNRIKLAVGRAQEGQGMGTEQSGAAPWLHHVRFIPGIASESAQLGWPGLRMGHFEFVYDT